MENGKISVSKILSFGFRATLAHISLFLGVAGYFFLGLLGIALVVISMMFLVVTIPLIFVVAPCMFIALDFGCRKVALEVYDRGNSEAGKVYSCFYSAFYGVIAWALYSVLSSIGFALLIIPGIIVQVRCGLFPYFIIDQKVGPIKALQMSWHVTEGHFWEIVGVWIIVKTLIYLGCITLIGWIITWPVSILAYAALYRALVPVVVRHNNIVNNV